MAGSFRDPPLFVATGLRITYCVRYMQTIRIQGITIRPVIGVYAHEQLAPQVVSVDLVVDLRRDTQNDQLDTTLDYDRLVAIVEAAATDHRLKLIETLGEIIADTCLAQETLVARIEVTVHKPAALKNGTVAVVTTRTREV